MSWGWRAIFPVQPRWLDWTGCDVHVERWEDFNRGIREGLRCLTREGIAIGHRKQLVHVAVEPPASNIRNRRRLQEAMSGRVEFRKHLCFCYVSVLHSN